LQSDYVDKEQQQIYQLYLHLSHPFSVRKLHASAISPTQTGTTEMQHCSSLGVWELGRRESKTQVGDGKRPEKLISSHPWPCKGHNQLIHLVPEHNHKSPAAIQPQQGGIQG